MQRIIHSTGILEVGKKDDIFTNIMFYLCFVFIIKIT